MASHATTQDPRGDSLDSLWLFCLTLLIAIGVIAIFSASSLYSLKLLGDEYYYVKRHLVFLILGAASFWAMTRVQLEKMRKFIYPLLLLSWLLLWLTLIPGLSHSAGGAARWLKLGFFTFQPSELFKLLFTLYLAHSLTKKKEIVRDFSKGFLPHLIVAGIGIIPLLFQPDLGSAVIIMALTMIMLFSAGARLRHLGSLILLQAAAFGVLVATSPYRMRRILAFLDPWEDAQNKGFQIIQSMVAFYHGGFSGVGLGNSQGKLFYLPAAHTDFILAVLGEELGFLGIVLIVLLFLVFFARTLFIAARAPEAFSKLMVLGFAFQIMLQMMINALVVTGLLPTKGLTLPFISSGGSSLLIVMLICGLIANVSLSKK